MNTCSDVPSVIFNVIKNMAYNVMSEQNTRMNIYSVVPNVIINVIERINYIIISEISTRTNTCSVVLNVTINVIKQELLRINWVAGGGMICTAQFPCVSYN